MIFLNHSMKTVEKEQRKKVFKKVSIFSCKFQKPTLLVRGFPLVLFNSCCSNFDREKAVTPEFVSCIRLT